MKIALTYFVIMRVEIPYPLLAMNTAAPDGAPPRWIRD